jgi:hypothetical protein
VYVAHCCLCRLYVVACYYGLDVLWINVFRSRENQRRKRRNRYRNPVQICESPSGTPTYHTYLLWLEARTFLVCGMLEILKTKHKNHKTPHTNLFMRSLGVKSTNHLSAVFLLSFGRKISKFCLVFSFVHFICAFVCICPQMICSQS